MATGNATVPSGTNPADPQEFVDAAVFLTEGDYNLWVGADYALGNVSITNLQRLVFMPTGVGAGLTYTFSFGAGGKGKFPDITNIEGTLNINVGITEAEFPSLSGIDGELYLGSTNLAALSMPALLLPFTGLMSLVTADITALPFGSAWTTFSGVLNLQNSLVAALPFANLEELSGIINASNCPITDPGFSDLGTITGTLNLANCGDATSFGLPALEVCSGVLNLSGFGSNDPFTDLSDLADVNFSGGTLNASAMGISAHGLGSIVVLDYTLNLSGNALTDADMDDLEEIADGGQLNLSGNTIEEPSFPALVALDGVLNLEDNSMLSLSAPALITIGLGGRLFLDSNAHTELTLEVLETCNGEIAAGSCDLFLPALTTIGSGAIVASTGPGVTAIDFTSLTNINGLLNLNGSNATCDFPTLVNIGPDGTLNLESTTGDVAADFGNLATVQGTLSFNDSTGITSVILTELTDIEGTVSFLRASVTSVGFPALEHISGVMNLSECGGLTSISFGALASISGELRIQNSMMPQADMNTLVASLYSSLSGTGQTGVIDFSNASDGNPQSSPAWSDLTSVITVIV
jgi:hypothetical protein